MRYSAITDERQFKSVTGLSRKEFGLLLQVFSKVHEEIFGNLLLLIKNGNHSNKLTSYEDSLLFTLYKLKSDPTYDNLGAIFGMSRSAANHNFQKFEKILKISLIREEVFPKRNFSSVKEFQEALQNEKAIIIDGSENPIERPKDPDLQKDTYSGKKKLHTDKLLIITNLMKWIYYVSEIYCGRGHDFSILKAEFTPGKSWFKNLEVLLDLGFQGFQKSYKCKKVYIPYKRPPSRDGIKIELTESQKNWNKKVSKKRIYVEHGIGGMKRYKILGYKSRGKNYDLKNEILGICAGLWNFKIKYSY